MKLKEIMEAKYYKDHALIQWIKHVFSFASVNSLLQVHVDNADEAIGLISSTYGPPIAIGHDYSEWNINTDSGQLYHLEVRDKAKGCSINLERVL